MVDFLAGQVACLCIAITTRGPPISDVNPEVAPESPLAKIGRCAVKGAGQQRVQVPPGNWIAPPGSNRSSRGGNETTEASGVEGRNRRLSEHAGRNVSKR